MLALVTSACFVEHTHAPPKAISTPKVPPRLLARVSEPKCMYTDEEPSVGESSEPGAETKAMEQSLQRRERERDCFRDAEHRVRAQLAELQASIRATVVASGPPRK